MRTETSPDYLNNHITKEMDEQINISGDLLSQAIENADGVPYQLTFGTGIGDGFFLVSHPKSSPRCFFNR